MKRTLLWILALGIIFRLSPFGIFDYFWYEDPKVGQIWVPDFEPAQSNWESFWDTKILDVKDGSVLVENHGLKHIESLYRFHMNFNFAREKEKI